MITNITSGVILKGSDVEFTVVLTNRCDWDEFNSAVLNFYTTGDTSIEYQIGDTTSITQTVHLQGVELEALPDGVLRYTSQYVDEDGDAHTVEMQTQFYLKTPIDYTPIDFASTEYVNEAIQGAIATGVSYSAGTNIDITNRFISVTGINIPDVSQFVTSADVKTQVEAYGYATTSQIPDVSNYVTSGDVATQIEEYHYTTSGDVNNQITAATSGLQETLVSGTNIKTINHQSLLGPGNITISSGSGGSFTAGDNIEITDENVINVTGVTSYPGYNAISGDVQNQVNAATSGKQDTLISGSNIKTINNQSVLGSGNITIEAGDVYTPGDNIQIENDTISVTGITSFPGFSAMSDSDVTTALGYTPISAIPNTYATTTYVDNSVSGKQDTIIAGNNIAINSNTVSVTGITSYPGYDAISGDVKSQIEGYGYATTSQIPDVSNFVTSGDVQNQITAGTSGLQETLVSGANIKTINNKTIVGSGNLNVGDIRGTRVTDVWTGTQAQYDAITAKSSTTLYFIV